MQAPEKTIPVEDALRAKIERPPRALLQLLSTRPPSVTAANRWSCSVRTPEQSVPGCSNCTVFPPPSSLALACLNAAPGAAAWRNARRIGKQWKLALSPLSTGATSTKQLDDVQLFLYVAVSRAET